MKIETARTWTEAMEHRKAKQGLTDTERQDMEEVVESLGLPEQGFHLTTRMDLIIAERKPILRGGEISGEKTS